MANPVGPSNSPEQAQPSDPLLYAVFGERLRSVGDVVLKGEPFAGLKIVGKKATLETTTETDALLQVVRTHFKLSSNNICPAYFFYHHPELLSFPVKPRELLDLAAVVTGQKPAALLSSYEMFGSPHGRELLRRAQDQGLAMATTTAPTDNRADPIFFVGIPENVQRLAFASYELRSLPLNDLGYRMKGTEHELSHREIGTALGYPKRAIDRFINGQNYESETLREVLEVIAVLPLVPFALLTRPLMPHLRTLYYSFLCALGFDSPLLPKPRDQAPPKA